MATRPRIGRVTPEAAARSPSAPALAEAVAAGELAVAVPDDVRVERPRNREHGDYAPTSPCSWPSRPGVPPRELADALAGAARARRRASRAVEVAGPGFLNITARRGGRRRAGAATIVEAGRGVRPRRRRRRAADQPRVRLGQPDRPDPHRRRPLGGRRRRARPHPRRPPGAEVTREYYFNDHGAQIDRFARSLLAARQRRADAGGRLRRRVHRRDRRPRSSATRPGRRSTCRDDEAQEVFRAIGVELMFAEIKRVAARLRRRLRRLLPRERLHESRRRRARRRAAARARATSTRRTARSGCAPPTSATTRTGWSSSPTASRPTSPATWPTTSTSASAASTACIIMLGADHHGYVGRLMAMCAALRRRPRREPRDPHRPAGQPASRTASRCGCASGPAPSSPSRTWSTRSASTPPATRWPAPPSTRTSTSTSTC